MKKFLIVAVLCALMTATSAFAFDPSLATKDGLGVKVEAEVDQFGMSKEMPTSTLQFYGAGVTYGLANTGTKVSLSAGGALLNVKDAFETRGYNAAAPYLTLGVSQKVYDLVGVKLGVFADGTYIGRFNDAYEGFNVGVAGMTFARLGGIAQYEVIKDLNVYAGMNGQWLNATLHADGEKMAVSNTSKLAGFGGVKYDFGAYAIDANVGGADDIHAAVNVAYHF